MNVTMKYAETFFLFLWGGISVLFLVKAAGFTEIARAVPNIAIVFLLGCIVFRLGQLWLKGSAKEAVLKIHRRTLPFILILSGYTAGIFLVGLMISSAIFVPLCMIWMGHRKLKLILLISFSYLLLVYLVFVVGFRMPLPDSLIGF